MVISLVGAIGVLVRLRPLCLALKLLLLELELGLELEGHCVEESAC